MKTTIAAAAAALALAAEAAAQDPVQMQRQSQPSIRVTGTGEVRAAPDQATADFAVETAASTAQEAAAANAHQMERVIAALVRAGVPRERIETRDYNVFPDYDPRPMEGGQPRVRGYRVMNTVSATTHDVTRVGAIIDAALSAGANRVHGVRFSLRDPQRFRAQAIQEATRRARADAEALAAAMGLQLGMVREASTVEVGYGGPVMLMGREAAADMVQAARTPINPGEQTVRATVLIVYAFSNAM
ncbi:MAG: SIMPL domain-containing protein [Gemmatimonadetes bacterium]|nr:SIMPL domain-containing protein [Gemmatimonadota bacterium]